MASPKNLLRLLIDLSNSLSNFLRSKTTSFLVAFFVISLFFFAGFLACNPRPAANLPFAPPFLTSSNSSSLMVSINSQPSDNRSTIISDVMLLKTFSTVSDIVKRAENSRKLEIDLKEGLVSCDIFDGNWVVDESNPSYEPGSCPVVDNAFNCVRNGRLDLEFMKLRWQPKKCNIPRLNGKVMLEMVRGKRLVFVGDSLNRNMWESLVCVLRGSLVDKSTISEISGRHEFRTDGFYAFRLSDYNCSIEFVRSPFLVQEWETADTKGIRKQTLRLDLIQQSSSKYRDADIIIFNTGHWWTHEKTSRGKDYYQEGDYVYKELNVAWAYKKALSTWAKWVDDNINPNRTRVFFRGYSASHFRGGQWHSGGNCDGETQPIKNDEHLAPYPKMMITLESVIRHMKTPVFYLNITRMTDYRKDGHPSVFRQPAAERQPNAFQDCSHWCLPGVPDAWNELLYAALLISNSDHRNHLQSEE